MHKNAAPFLTCSGLIILLMITKIATAHTSPDSTEPRVFSWDSLTECSRKDSTYFREPFPTASPSHTIHSSVRGSAANPYADHWLVNCLDTLPNLCCSEVEFFGYFQHGITLNPESPSNRVNGPVVPNYRSNAYQLNGLYLVSQKSIDTACDQVQLGGRFDVLYGTDGIFSVSEGFDENISSGRRFYKFAFPQLYANLYLPVGRGVSFKFGKFFTPVGNEVKYNPNNFFYSYDLTFGLQPGNHTGMLAETELTDNIHIRFGPNLGWNTSEDSNDAVSYAGDIRWQSTDQLSELIFAIQTGRQKTRIVTAASNVTVYSLLFKQDMNENWRVMLEHDLLISNSVVGVSTDDFEAYSLVGYLFRNVNRHWRAGVRLEWLRDDDGFVRPFASTSPSAPSSYYEITLGLNWRPRAHLRIRPEIRYDHQARDDRSLPAAFDNGNSADQWLFSCDALWEF